jgi:hypothetical protein
LRDHGLYLESRVQRHIRQVFAGALLIDRITDELFAGPDIMAINSCAAEASFMAQLWAGRRTMVDMLVGLGPQSRSTKFGFMSKGLVWSSV